MKTLLLDIESSPNTAFVWGLFKQNITIDKLIDTSKILCWSARWLGSNETIFDSLYISEPLSMIKHIHSLLEEADVVITYNGNSFDLPILNKEFLLFGLDKPAPYKSIDLYRVGKQQFKFTSHKLDHIAQQLGLGKKKDTNFQLWIDCMNDVPEAWKKMSDYNVQDVLLLEKLYNKFKSWIKNHANYNLYGNTLVCPNCGGEHYHKRGTYHTSANEYQRYKCTRCGTWFRSNKTQLKGKERFVYAT